MSTQDTPPNPALLRAVFPPSRPNPDEESPSIQSLINTLNLQPHIEGGYFVETDRDTRRVANPFVPSPSTTNKHSPEPSTRSASTSIFYLLTPGSPLGAFHRNRGRTVHTLHRGRGRYVILHADEVASGKEGYPGDDGSLEEGMRWKGRVRVEVFTVGLDVANGERLQWIVDGGKYKASFLLEDLEGKAQSGGCLISETVVPGFEYEDHDFMTRERFDVLVPEGWKGELEWMLRKAD